LVSLVNKVKTTHPKKESLPNIYNNLQFDYLITEYY
jgi:hypothetical protein